MIRLAALNDDSSKSSDKDIVHPKEPSQEVQEENALKLYNEALLDQKNGNLEKAEGTYKQLLSSNLLLKVKPDVEKPREKRPHDISSIYAKPSVMLKYSCLKNLAVISLKKDLLNDALDYYSQALDIEGSDVTLWHQAGYIAMKLSHITIACHSFLEGLECSPKHWLCLDKLIMCLFALGDYVHCLEFVSKAFQMDKNYTRGQVIRDYILKEQPSLEHDIKLFFPKINLHINEKCCEREEVREKLLNEVISVKSKYHEKCGSQRLHELAERSCVDMPRVIEIPTWVNLGESIVQLHEYMTSQDGHMSLLSAVNLKKALQQSKKTDDVKDESQELKNADSTIEGGDKPDEQVSAQEQIEEAPDKKNKKSRGSALMEELLWSGKRRSARVRSSLRGNHEPMDVAEALRRILPRKLLHKTKQFKNDHPMDSKVLEEDSMDTMDLYRLFERQESAEERQQKEDQERSEVEHDVDKIVESEGYFGKNPEYSDVESFIESHDQKDITQILKLLIIALESHHKKTWPNLLPNIYIKCYRLMRKYYPLNFKMCSTDRELQELSTEAGNILLYGELCQDHVSAVRNKAAKDTELENDLPVMFMQNIMELVDRNQLFPSEENYFEFLVRVYWLRCHMFLARGQTNFAINSLNDILASYELHPHNESTIVHLKNCRKNSIISKSITEEFLAYQSRKRSLAEVVRLYEDESYRELTEILKETFTTTPDTVNSQIKDQESELVDRQTQLSMLINGLYHLNEYKECVEWLETCCYEVMHRTSLPSSYRDEESETWMVAFDRFLAAIEDCLNLGEMTIGEVLPPQRVSRFAQTLCHAICKHMEDSDRPPSPSRPWIMLNRILKGLEADEKDGAAPEDDEDEESDIPSSILILFTAHEYLGRREWCSCNDSVLLFLIMDHVIPHIRNPDWASFRETIQQHLEQVVYCLYSHPNKKSKARYLTDHNVTPIPLTWNRGIQLFEMFRPDETPAFDSLRVNLIGSDTEVLFRRIAALIPDENDPVQNSEKMTDFIVGKRNDVPEANIKLPEHVQDLFYILGDYYFKTHESAKAVNYLLIDLCANPNRVDSWASMALSRASILEQQLNSCDPIKDEVFLQDALSALRCYEHCLQLENNQCTLWIEYGTFVYTVHSFCSQRMKLESDSLSIEQFEELETTKNKMLETAKQAFINANLIWYEMKEETDRQDERWLHHYMLGKISEKHGDLNYFEHYEKAAELLYENEAEFPTKVGYTAPQTLAIEALEVYYRIHVCVIKNLELNEGKPLDPKTRLLFSKYLDLCANGPFVKQLSKADLAKQKAKESELAVQKEKQAKIIRDLVNGMISKIELQAVKETADAKSEEKPKSVEPVEVTVEEAVNQEEVISEEIEMKDEENVVKSESDAEIVLIEEKKTEDPLKMDEVEETDIFDEGEPLIQLAEVAAEEYETDPMLMSLPLEYEEYQRYHQYQQDNYYLTLDDIRNMPPPSVHPKKKRRTSHPSVSSSSCESDEIKYDDSSSSSSSSESSATSPSSSSSSSETSESDVNKEAAKRLEVDEAGKEKKAEEKAEEKTEEIPATQEEPIPVIPATPVAPVPPVPPPVVNEPEAVMEPEEKPPPIVRDDSEDDMLKQCLAALETCAMRFPQHYKSVYRLAHFYFRSKEHRDIAKCRDLLLGRYQTSKGTITGLFADRKITNFFNGIWRIPAADVDRPGSFASHMSRSVLLLMEVLRDLKDHKMLLELCLQLRKVPEPDKKYLREDERNQLSVQAVNLSIQTLRKNVKESTVMTLPIVLDSYRCYQKVQKHYPHKEAIFGDIMLEAFKRLGKGDKCTVEQAIRFCQSEISAGKTKASKNASPNQPSTFSTSAAPKTKTTKSKKQERKKALPKPQVTAKAIPKVPKPKKLSETKKKPAINSLFETNLISDPKYWAAMMKNTTGKTSIEQLMKSSSSSTPQNYTELLKSTAQSTKNREQSEKQVKMMDQMVARSMIDQMSMEYSQQLLLEQMKLISNPSLYAQYHNYAMDYGSDLYKQYNAFYNRALIGNYFSQIDSSKKPRIKHSKPRSLLKPKINKPEAVGAATNTTTTTTTTTTAAAAAIANTASEGAAAAASASSSSSKLEEKKHKTNFNIDDILGTSSKVPKPQSPNILTPSQLNMSIEDKIKSAFNDTETPKHQVEAINLSPNRKKLTEAIKRPAPPPELQPETSKKICRNPIVAPPKTDEIEVVVIDD